MPFLAPLFLGGMALLALPWYLHHVRRPEHEPVRFSSLLFIPELKQEVVKHRRIQHLLLMLIRMLLLLLLALAFSRPFREFSLALLEDSDSAQHVILIDTSYSMGTLGWFDDAKKEALRIIDEMAPGERVGIVGFAKAPVLEKSVDDDIGAARDAIRTLAITEESTAYGPALQLAEEVLTTENRPEHSVVYLISDFQKVGMPQSKSNWRLAPGIDFVPIEVGDPGVSNQSIMDLSVRELKKGTLRVQAKVKNWSQDEEKPLNVKLLVNEETVGEKELVVGAGNARQAFFSIAAPAEGMVGRLEINDEVLAVDNLRYFTWTAKARENVIIVSDSERSKSKRWPAATLLTHVLPDSFDSPWKVSVMDQKEINAHLNKDDGIPKVLLVCDLAGIQQDSSTAILNYVSEGGAAVLSLNESMDMAALNELLLQPLGLRATGLRYASLDETQFDLLSSVDLDHAIFFPFRGSRFNDFSHIRFFNYYRLELDSPEPMILARFEGEDEDAGDPAIVEIAFGDGRIIVWPFAIDLDWTNLPKTSRFLPLVHETIHYLSGEDGDERSWQIGDQPAAPAMQKGLWKAEIPGGAVLDVAGSVSLPKPLDRVGVLRWKQENGNGGWIAEAVNVDSREANPARISPAEFELAFCSTPVLDRNIRNAAGASVAALEDEVSRQEFGLYAIGIFLFFLLVESWLASRLTRPLHKDSINYA